MFCEGRDLGERRPAWAGGCGTTGRRIELDLVGSRPTDHLNGASPGYLEQLVGRRGGRRPAPAKKWPGGGRPKGDQLVDRGDYRPDKRAFYSPAQPAV